MGSYTLSQKMRIDFAVLVYEGCFWPKIGSKSLAQSSPRGRSPPSFPVGLTRQAANAAILGWFGLFPDSGCGRPPSFEPKSMTGVEPWSSPEWVARARLIIESFRRRLGKDLVPTTGSDLVVSEALFRAPFVVVAHGTGVDPLLTYANGVALRLWEMDPDTLARTPSRLTAEPVHRDERARILERTTREGYVDDYSGVRISRSGRRFMIERATVWNLDDASGRLLGQAAMFDTWTPLGRAP